MKPKENNIGFLRLILASFVIIGHAPEMLDGDRSREPLTVIFHTVSLGELAVDGFLVLSGYLITQSFTRSPTILDYAIKRFARIFPGYIVAYAASVFVLGPLVGARPQDHLVPTLINAIFLQPPIPYDGQFPGMSSYPFLNGSLWTIAYEARFYVLIGILGSCNLLTKKFVLGLTALSLIVGIANANVAVQHFLNHPPLLWRFAGIYELCFGYNSQTARLLPSFLCGATAFLWRDELFRRLNRMSAGLCSLIAVGLMYRNPYLAMPGLVTFGGAALLWLAWQANLGALGRINRNWDISYGCYLYGWPIGTYIRWQFPDITPAILIVMSLPLSFFFGAVSWWLVEQPARRRIFGRLMKNQQPHMAL